jgi:stalled ribosome rescue protein Dom34
MNIAARLTMPKYHAAVWIDHNEAKIFHIDRDGVEKSTVEAPHGHVRRHPTVTAERNHPADGEHFYHEVVKALTGAEEILVVGPSTAKLELIKHVHKHDHAFAPKIIGVETVDHPTDGQLLKYVRTYFIAADRLR